MFTRPYMNYIDCVNKLPGGREALGHSADQNLYTSMTKTGQMNHRVDVILFSNGTDMDTLPRSTVSGEYKPPAGRYLDMGGCRRRLDSPDDDSVKTKTKKNGQSRVTLQAAGHGVTCWTASAVSAAVLCQISYFNAANVGEMSPAAGSPGSGSQEGWGGEALSAAWQANRSVPPPSL